MRSARLEPLDERDLLLQHRLLPLVLCRRVTVGDGALADIELVIAGVSGQLAVVDLDDLADHPVHELAVVRGHENGALEAFEEVLQPDERLQIEMIGRLVEQQRVGPHQ